MDSPKKTKPISAKATPQEHELIMQAAAQAGQSASSYLIDCALGKNKISASELRQIYCTLTKIKDAATNMHDTPQAAQMIRKECDALWASLNL